MFRIDTKLTLLMLLLVAAIFNVYADDYRHESPKNMFEDYYVSRMRDTTLTMEKRLESARNLIDKQKNVRTGLLLEYVDMCQTWGSYKEAERVLDIICKRLSSDSGDEVSHLSYMFLSARNHYRLSHYDKSAKESFEIIACKKPDSLRRYDTFARLLLANVYLRVGREITVENYINEIAADLEKVNFHDSSTEMFVRWQLSKVRLALNINRKNVDEAFADYRNNLKYQYSEQARNCDAIFRAELYDYLEEYKISDDIYRELVAMPRLSPEHRMVVVNNYSWMMLNNNRADEALKLLEDNADAIEQIENDHLRCFLYNSLARAYAETGCYEKAYERSRKAQTLVNTFFSDDVNQRLVTLGDQYDSEVLMAIERAEHRRAMIIIVALVVAVALVLLLLVMIWRRTMANRRLGAQLAELSSRLEVYDESRKAEIDSANELIDTKNRELATMAMHNANVGKLLDDIVDAVDDHSKPAEERFELIRREIRRLDMQHSMWDMFNTFFSQVHQSFFANLSARHPSLTKGELRMCAFMVLNLTSKEIALITNRSARTVDTIKYSLRKKMQVDESMPTVAYLRKFL